MTQKKCKVRLIDEVTAYVVGLETADMRTLYDKFAVTTANYFFSPLYKLGQWDGKIRYFQSNGRTYVYLLDQILPILSKMKYKVELEDLRRGVSYDPDPITIETYAHIPHVDTGEPTYLRDYQVEGVNALIENGYGVLLASTGAGKTLICTALVDAYGKKGINTITIVPNQDLIKQTKVDYVHYGLDVGEYSGTCKDLDHQHIISTWQALKNNPSIIKQFQLVLVDECLAGDTKVSMADGSEKEIKDVEPGDFVLTKNEQTGAIEPNRVVKRHENLMVSSEERMYQLTFDNGTVIEITGNHKCFTANRGWVRADELTEEDDVQTID